MPAIAPFAPMTRRAEICSPLATVRVWRSGLMETSVTLLCRKATLLGIRPRSRFTSALYSMPYSTMGLISARLPEPCHPYVVVAQRRRQHLVEHGGAAQRVDMR